MSKKSIRAVALGIALLFTIGLAMPALIQAKPSQLPDETTYLNGHNFSQTYWSTELDWIQIFKSAITEFEATPLLADRNISLTGMLPPELDNISVMTYHAFVNQYNYWMFYSGFEYASFDNGSTQFNGTIPMQSIIQSYRSSSGLEVYSIQTYLMTAYFQDNITDQGIYDEGEPLFVTIGFSLNIPAFSSLFPGNETLATEIFNEPILVTTDELTPIDGGYTWGMRYHHVKLLIFDHETGDLLALIVIGELDFQYVLGFDTANGKVTINTQYTIGAPEKLLMDNGTLIENTESNDYNLTKWLCDHKLRIAIVNLQLTSVIDPYHHPVSVVVNDTAIDNSTEGLDLSDSWYTTYSGDERIFQVDFGSKQTYSTTHPNGTETGDHLAITRIYNAHLGEDLMSNPFYMISTALINIPSLIAVLYMSDNIIMGLRALFGIMFPFIHGGETVLSEINNVIPLNIEANINYYVIYYPAWNGQKIVHDPTFVAFADLSALLNPAILAPLVVVGILAVVVVAMVIMRRRR